MIDAGKINLFIISLWRNIVLVLNCDSIDEVFDSFINIEIKEEGEKENVSFL